MRKILWLIGVTVALVACVSQQQPIGFESYGASATNTTLIPVTANSALKIVGGIGDVTIRVWDRADKLELTYTKIAYGVSEKDAKEELDDVLFSFDVVEDAITITTTQRQPNTPQRANRVDLELRVPNTLALDIFVAIGDVTINGVRAAGGLAVRSMTGDLALTEVSAPDGMTIQSQAGSALFIGTIGAAGDYEVTANIGDLTVRLPANTVAQVDAATTLGAITTGGVALISAQRESVGAGATLRASVGAETGPTLTLRNQMGNIELMVGSR